MTDIYPTPTPDAGAVNAAVAARIRARRKQLGISQERLAGAIDVTFQQVQKYERGLNRISVGRLAQIAHALGVTTTWLLDGLDDPAASAPARIEAEIAEALTRLDDDGRASLIGLVRSLARRAA